MTDLSTAAPAPAHRHPTGHRWGKAARLAGWRALVALPITALVSMIVFWLASIAPFNPLAAYLGRRFERASVEERTALVEQLGIDDSWVTVWGRWARDVVLHWDWGYSRTASRPVAEAIAERLPWTLLLTGVGITLGIVISLVLGVAAARRPGSAVDRFATGLAHIVQGVPPFVIALGAIVLFALTLRWLPVAGVSRGGADVTWGSTITHLILPALVLGLSQVPWMLLNVRTSVSTALTEDHVTAARARGLPERTVVWRHALPGALLPFVTVIGARLPELVTGAVLVETVFAWPGLASATVHAAVSGDFPLLAAVTVLTCLMVLIGSLVADALYVLVDPRVDDA